MLKLFFLPRIYYFFMFCFRITISTNSAERYLMCRHFSAARTEQSIYTQIIFIVCRTFAELQLWPSMVTATIFDLYNTKRPFHSGLVAAPGTSLHQAIPGPFSVPFNDCHNLQIPLDLQYIYILYRQLYTFVAVAHNTAPRLACNE